MTTNDGEASLEDMQTQEGVAGVDAAEELSSAPEEKRSFTEIHPDAARRERERAGEDAPGS